MIGLAVAQSLAEQLSESNQVLTGLPIQPADCLPDSSVYMIVVRPIVPIMSMGSRLEFYIYFSNITMHITAQGIGIHSFVYADPLFPDNALALIEQITAVCRRGDEC